MIKRNFFTRLLMVSAIAFAFNSSVSSQTDVGASCGCPDVGARNTIVVGTSQAVIGGAGDGNLIADHTIWTCDNIYILDKKIFVPSGKTLTIRPGTVIKGNTSPTANNATALVVSRGGTIIAPGSEECPIIFTAAADPLDGTYSLQSQWGGVVLLGRATNNLLQSNGLGVADGLGIIEGFGTSDPRGYYGADINGQLGPAEQFDNDDNSGLMSYVSIRHGGATVAPDNELNGLTLGSVGRGTCLHHIEIVMNSDDGIEFFGGTVDLKYGAVFHNDDDGFDWDHGWSGRGQFWVVVKGNKKGDNGLEIDGDDDNSGASPLSNPTIYNITAIGTDSVGVNSGDNGIEAKELTRGSIFNSIFAGYKNGLNMNDTSDRSPDAYQNWLAGTFNVKNSTFIGNTNPLSRDQKSSLITGSDNSKFASDANVVVSSVSGFDFNAYVEGTTVLDQYDAVPVPGLGNTASVPVDGFFCPAQYRGAFDPNAKSWLSNWSYAAFIESTKGLQACPTDINLDGITNNADFLLLLGKFNQSCE